MRPPLPYPPPDLDAGYFLDLGLAAAFLAAGFLDPAPKESRVLAAGLAALLFLPGLRLLVAIK